MTITNVKLITIFEAMNETTDIARDVLKAINEKGIFVDNHNDKITELNKDKMALLLLQGTNGLEYVCPAYKMSAFCMNPLYLDKETGYVHLSTASVAGTIHRSRDNNHLAELCNNYNEDRVCGPSIKAVIEL